MFEAMICSSSRLVPRRLLSAAIRLKTLRRGRIARHDVVAAERDPVADRREVRARERLEPERPRHAGRPVAGAVADDRGLAMDGDDPGRADALGRERREGGLPVGVPAEGLERRVERSRRPSAQPTRFNLPVRLA